MAAAQSFVLNAQASAGLVNSNGKVTASNVGTNSATLGIAPATASTSATASVPGITCTQNVSGALTDSAHGSISYFDGWQASGIANGYANVNGVSSYTFDLATAASLDVTWTASFSSDFYTPGFGIWNAIMFVDGSWNLVTPGGWVTPLASGGWNINLTAGTHTIAFEDFSNISGGLGTHYSYLNETLSFAIGGQVTPSSGGNPPPLGGGGSTPTVPAPGVVLVFVSGLARILRSRMTKRA